jgi:hypothetical protein
MRMVSAMPCPVFGIFLTNDLWLPPWNPCPLSSDQGGFRHCLAARYSGGWGKCGFDVSQALPKGIDN